MITSYEIFAPLLMGNGSSLRTGLKVRQLGCKKVLLVYDKGLKDLGVSDIISENLENAGIEVVSFDKVLPDPPDYIVEEGAVFAQNEKIDGIVAVGGGSSIDTAKAINVLMNNPPPITQYFGANVKLKAGVPMVFIPTTSGTGSEVTNMTVISCPSLGKKDSVVHPVCVASLAIVDPELTIGLPKRLTAATGVDALSHAVESLTGSQANPLSDALARESIRMITKWLPIAYEDGSNIEAREHMILASTFSGMAFTNGLVHLGHGIGHTLGANFHIPHGIACAIALPEVVEYASKTESNKVKMICECMGVDLKEDATPDEIGAIAKDALRAFIKSVGIPNLKDLGIQYEDVLKMVPLVTQDTALALAPYRITAAGIAKILESAYDA